MRKLITKGEAADLLGLTKSQIRFYEKKGLLKPQVDDNGYAMYDFGDLDILEMIILLKELNTPIKEMKRIINDEAHYDYEYFLKRSYDNLLKEMDELKNKKKTIEKKLKLYNQDVINTFKIESLEERALYVLDQENPIDTLKNVYDLIKTHNIDYLDYDNEYCSIKNDTSEYEGFINLKGEVIDSEVMVYKIHKGQYFSYFMSYNYDDDYELYVKRFREEAHKRGIHINNEIIFIDHFGRKFYERHRVIGTIQARIIES